MMNGVGVMNSNEKASDNSLYIGYDEKTLDEKLATAKTIDEGSIKRQRDIEEIVSKRTGIDIDVVHLIFNESWQVIFDVASQGDSIKLHGIGQFYLSKRASRMGRNPNSGVEHIVEARELFSFKTSVAFARRLKPFRDAVNAKKVY